ncbi:MAG TPA: hypothetical protein VLK29_10355 [Luteimonas sp.]|nr:hypothetical protein [Luteimonas sp.]
MSATRESGSAAAVARRQRAVRTALILAGVAVLVYAGFILMGVLAQ